MFLIFCLTSIKLLPIGDDNKPQLYAKKPNFLDAVTLESNCLTDPAAAFLGFANSGKEFCILKLLILSNSELEIKISPLISISSGYLPFRVFGISSMVLILSVIFSPCLPSPLVAPRINLPFLYINVADKPSILGSATNSIFSF